MAKIESLPNTGWSPAAALANLLEDVDDVSEVFIIYRDLEGNQYSQAGNMLYKDALWMLEFEKQRLIQAKMAGIIDDQEE